MPTATRTFRVFVSSTFEDLRAERNVLQEKVFPVLERFCLEKGARFQAIDLRWGVREEAGLDQKTMEICLAEIARCQKTRIKPNFVVLLGNRYGWRPLPARVRQDEFEAVLAHISEAGERDFAASWYDLDLNAEPPEYLLKPRKGIYTDWDEWKPVEKQIHEALREGARAVGLSLPALVKYEASATHQEILKGLGEKAEDRAHVFAFFRESAGEEDRDLTKLKDHLKAVLPEGNIFPYSVGDHDRLCDDVERSLKAIIAATAAQFETQSENASHGRFADDRAKNFKGRKVVLEAIEQYLRGDDRRPLVVYGPSGSGKSAIIAVASRGKNAIRRFIGATPDSSSGVTLLRGLCGALGERFSQAGDLPATFNELSPMFSDRLKLATAEQPVILFIDALDQLSAQDPAAAMSWLPSELPPYCHVVVSATEIPTALWRAGMVPVEPLPVEDADLALDSWFTEACRTLQSDQRKKLMASFLQSGLPLYLKLAFEEVRLWRSFDPPDECVLGDGLAGIIAQLFARLSDPANHGPILVGHALGYLTAARYGLTEDEILAVLTKDDVVWKDVVGQGERRRHDPPLRQLPVIVWSRLHLDLEPYLTERTVPGGTTVSFYHRQLAERVETTLLHHNARATHFAKQSYWLAADVPNRRMLTELVRQQVDAGLLDDADAVLTDLDFVSAECAAELVFDLEEDYRVAIAALPEAQAELREEERRQAELARWTRTLVECAEQKRLPKLEEIIQSVEPWSHERIAAESKRIIENPTRLDRLKAFAGFVEQELYPLDEFGKRRGFVVQHAVNSAPRGAVHLGAAQRVKTTGAPLLLRRSSLGDEYSPKPALLRRLAGHTGSVTSVSVTPDGRRALSGSLDNTLRVWDLKSSACLRTLEGHTNGVYGVSVTPDGRRAVSGSRDRTLRVWDLESGACLRTLEGHTDWVICVGEMRDARRAVSGSHDRTLRVWDLESGACLRTLEGHRNGVTSVSVTPDGRRALSGSLDNTLRVWDLESGVCMRTLEGHSSGVLTPDGRCAMSVGGDFSLREWDLESGSCLRTLGRGPNGVFSVTPDTRLAMSISGDDSLRMWALESGACLRTLEGHANYVSSVTVMPDGRCAVSGSGDCSLRVWNLESGACPHTLKAHRSTVSSVTVTPDGRRAVSGGWDDELQVWDLESGTCLRRLKGHTGSVYGVSLTPDGRRAVSGSGDMTLRVWDLESGTCLRRLEGHTGWVSSVNVTRDGRRVVSGSHDNTVRVWDLESDACLCKLEGHADYVRTVCVTPDGRRVVSGSRDDTLRVWDLESGACLHRLEGHTNWVDSVSVTPDGRRAVSGSLDCTVRVWDLESGACLRRLEGHTGGVRSVSVTPHGGWAVSGGWDNTLRLWNLESGACDAVLGLSAPVASVGISGPLNRVIVGTSTGEVAFYDLRGIDLGSEVGLPARVPEPLPSKRSHWWRRLIDG